jgi:peroxiredoxin Q/BCP
VTATPDAAGSGQAAPTPDGPVRVGDPAPDFDLVGIDGRTGLEGRWRRSDLLGAPLVVAFYPADDTPVCTAQLRSYTEGVGALDRLGASVLAISPQDVESHRAFAAANDGFAFPLLCDPDKAVGRAWGILGLRDLYRRSTFVVDAEGIVRYSHRSIGPGRSFKPLDELVAAVLDTL